MRILLDECLPKQMRLLLSGHEVKTVAQAGWAGVKNGELLKLAEGKFDVFLTIDQNLLHQQNISRFEIGFLVGRSVKNIFYVQPRAWVQAYFTKLNKKEN